MLANQQFNMRLNPETKRMLELLAAKEGRSKANMVQNLIRERYQAVAATPPKLQEGTPQQVQPAV